MLGVATGIFAITGILTMVNSLQKSATESVANLGNTTIFVHHWPWAEGNNEWYKFIGRPKVSYRDFQKLKQNLTRVRGVSYEVSLRNQSIRAEGLSMSNLEVLGITHDAGEIKDMNFEDGRYFTEVESHLGSPVCIVGFNVAENLFPDSRAVGQYMRVRGKRMRVIGVQEKKGAGLFPGMPSEDDRVYIPYRQLSSTMNTEKRSIEKVITVKAERYEELELVESDIIGLMRSARGLKPKIENNFAINKQEALMNRFESFFGYLKTGGWVISIFSILIGGFSIGNIMYISVRERTSEIGVQKALGSTGPFILYQFVSEAIYICLLGGVIGLLLVFVMGGA
ncbi:MAG: ABC transporter permease, partial [Bacteroidota bacterium]